MLSASPGYRVFKRLSALTVPSPALRWVLIDEREDSIDDACFAVNMTGYPDALRTITRLNYPASYHGTRLGWRLQMDISKSDVSVIRAPRWR